MLTKCGFQTQEDYLNPLDYAHLITSLGDNYTIPPRNNLSGITLVYHIEYLLSLTVFIVHTLHFIFFLVVTTRSSGARASLLRPLPLVLICTLT